MKNKLNSLLNQIFASGFSFLVLIISAKLLTGNDFGIISLIILLILTISVIPQSFIQMSVMSNSNKFTNKLYYFNNNSLLNIILIIFIIILLWCVYIINIFNVQNLFSFNSIVIYFISFQLYELTKKFLFVENKHILATYLESLKLLVPTIIFSILILKENFTFSIDSILIIVSIGYISFLIPCLKYFNFKNINFNDIKKITIENYHFGKWIFLSNTIQNINSNLYIYISAFILPIYIIGVLNAIRSFIGFSTVIFLTLDNYLTPKYASFYLANSKEKLENSVYSTYNKIGLLFIISYIFLGLFSEFILLTIYNKEISEYYYFIYFFLFANILMYYTRPIIVLSKTIGLTKILYLSSLPVLLFTIIFTYPMISYFETIGALIILCLGQLFHLISLKYFYKKESINHE